jgi:nucleotide-binding universal stress UspA family protein
MFKTVLFPIDPSPESREAADLVVELVQFHKSRLVLLSVVQPEGEYDEAVVAELLAGVRAMFADRGIEAETLTRQGKASFTICDVADEINADVIVMGCRGTGLTAEGATESTSHRTIELSPCPVLVVP